jgi:hypothetical protein
MEKEQPLCLGCADLDHLVYLPAGDAALSRRSRKHSTLSAVVVRFSRARKRYERQGLLVEASALEQAEQECLNDEEQRLRLQPCCLAVSVRTPITSKCSREIRVAYLGCPTADAEGSLHACP